LKMKDDHCLRTVCERDRITAESKPVRGCPLGRMKTREVRRSPWDDLESGPQGSDLGSLEAAKWGFGRGAHLMAQRLRLPGSREAARNESISGREASWRRRGAGDLVSFLHSLHRCVCLRAALLYIQSFGLSPKSRISD
jgi:hypothetical protein